MNDYDAWIGREELRPDRIDPAALGRWLATLDREPASDGAVPQGYHWCLGLPDAATAALGPDGHPRRDDSPGSFLPPIPQPRRMWASSAVEFVRPLAAGEAVERRSRVARITAKTGGSGALVFVEVEHETSATHGGANALAVRETQSLVYRDPPPPGSPAVPPPLGDARFDPAGRDAHRALTPGEPLLFRFSALTFNSHRIHYDIEYARGQEGFRGLVVHGPLTATLLLDLARREFGDNALARFAFRGVSPAIAGETLHLALRRSGSAVELGAFAADGRAVMSATASLR